MEKLEPVLELIKGTETWRILLVPLVIMCVDYLTGFLKAYKKKKIISSKMRDGLIKKFGEMMMIIVSVILQYLVGIPVYISVSISAYIVIMELISISENLGEMGVPIPNWLTNRLKVLVEDEENV